MTPPNPPRPDPDSEPLQPENLQRETLQPEFADPRLLAALRRTQSPDPAALAHLVAQVEEAARSVPARRPSLLRPPRAAAAALLVIALGVLVTWLARPRVTGPTAHEVAARRWHATFSDAIANGYPSPGCCAPVVDLTNQCTKLFSCPLSLAHDDKVELCGFYCGTFCSQRGDDPAVLLLRVGGEPVCVFVMRLASDPAPDVATLAAAELAVRRREIPPLVLYELKRAPTPNVLERFALAQ